MTYKKEWRIGKHTGEQVEDVSEDQAKYDLFKMFRVEEKLNESNTLMLDLDNLTFRGVTCLNEPFCIRYVKL